ncbi:probable serine/threonine-protein kinase DDB_G0278845 [Prorops nasuta]|uniref:probable serine/threonine-protein kinase DDB_G0278845 n=1 Tax=Prorops nasuta TaxID=863751 RepID=UPI0034CF2644
MGQGTEACTNRPTEVSVIRFVSRNRTIEEIAPKKEIYTCKQRGCGKIFTNQDEYKTHEALEALKIRFICREPGCGEELSDPGSMWRHYQEWHNNETNVFVCPYTNCGSVHVTSNSLEEHIESCHRQPPTLPTEPEVICFEGPENTVDDEIIQNNEDHSYENQQAENFNATGTDYDNTSSNLSRSETENQQKDFCNDQCKTFIATKTEEYSVSDESFNHVGIFAKNETVLSTKENFVIKYDTGTLKRTELLQMENSQDKSNVVYINGDVTITKNIKNETSNLNTSQKSQEHRVDMGNLEKIFRNSLEHEPTKAEDNSIENNSNCSDDEEYTPKKQRMSRFKQETYKCDINGCGKRYKYISHYRHHQDSHKLTANTINSNSSRQIEKLKQGKASTVSFFLCKMPGCGAQVNNGTTLWKHYQDNHANSKSSLTQNKTSESFRCKFPGCDIEFSTTLMLYKHFNEVHSNGSINNSNTNIKTGSGNSFHFGESFQNDATTQQANLKTDFKAKHNVNLNDYKDNCDEHTLSPVVKEESRD